MYLIHRIVRRLVMINLKPINKSDMIQKPQARLMFSNAVYSKQKIQSISTTQQKNKSFDKEAKNINKNQQWFIVDLLKMMSLSAQQGQFSNALMQDLQNLVNNANSQDFLNQNIFYAISQFIDIKSNIPLLKNARIQAYSKLYNKLDPYQRQIIFQDYIQTFRVGQFTNFFISDLSNQTSNLKDFKPTQLPNRDTEFQYVFIRIKNRLGLQNIVNYEKLDNVKRSLNIEKLIDQYLSILQNKNRLGKLVKYYQSSDIFLTGINYTFHFKSSFLNKYKQRLAKIITTIYHPQNYGILLPKDEKIQSVLISNFSPNDRLLLKQALYYICQHSLDRSAVVKVETLTIIQYFNYEYPALVLAAFKYFHIKLKHIKSIPKQFQFKAQQEVLMACVLLQNLKFRTIIKHLISSQDLLDFVDLFVTTFEKFILINSASVPTNNISYKNIKQQYLNYGKINSFSEVYISRYSQSIQKLVDNQKLLGICQFINYDNNEKIENEKLQISIFTLQFEAIHTMLLLLKDDQRKISILKEITTSQNFSKQKFLKYVCFPKLYTTFIQIKAMLKKENKIYWNLLDKETQKMIKKKFNKTWNNLDMLLQKHNNSFIQDLKYNQNLFQIDPSFCPNLYFLKNNPLISNRQKLSFQSSFTCNEYNILQNAVQNKIFPLMFQQSKLKSSIEQILKQKNIRYMKNYVEYPYFADFMIYGSKKIIFYCIDYTKLFMASEMTPIKCYSDSVKYFHQNSKVITFNYFQQYDNLKEQVIKYLNQIK